MKSPPKMPQRAMVRIWVASLHQGLRYPMGTGVSVLSVLQKGLQGWIRTASTRRIVRRVKKPLCNSDDRCQRQKQGGAVGAAASRMRVPPKARRSRWEPRPGFLFILRGSRHPPAPTKKPQRITLHSPFPVSSLPQGRLALQGNKKRRFAISHEASLPLMLKV